jgi:hypothetical protein
MAVEDIIVSWGVIYYAPVGESLPDETTVAFGGAWGGNWTALGYFAEGAPLSWNPTITKYPVRAQQTTGVLRRVITQEDIAIETTLIEVTADNLELALEGTVTDTAAGAAQKAFSKLEGGGQFVPDVYAWGIEMMRIDASGNQQPLRLFIFKGEATINGTLAFSKAVETGVPIHIDGNLDLSKAVGKQYYKVDIVTGPTT